MSEPIDQMDEAALAMMSEEGLLTADQAKRLRSAVSKGKSLRDALASIPMVEPLQFMRIERLVAQEEIAPSTSLFQAQMALNESTPSNKPKVQLAGLGKRQADNILDFDSIDIVGGNFVIAPISTGLVESTDEFALGAASTEIAALLPEAQMRIPAAVDLSRTLLPPDSPDSYLATTSVGQIYPLDEDDGIPMLKRLHGALRELIDMEGMGIEIDWPGGDTGLLKFYHPSGKLAMHRPLDDGDAAKFINRLKIMARIEPWRRDSPRGSFLVEHSGKQHRIMLGVVTRSDDTETATAFLKGV